MDLKEGIIRDRRQYAIGVVGMGRGAGATTLAASVASEMGKITGSAAFLGDEKEQELDVPKIYDRLCLANRLKRERSGKVHLYGHVNWVTEMDFIPKGDVEIFENIHGQYLVIDQPKPCIWSELDVILGVIDPLPSRMKAGLHSYQELCNYEREGGNVVWVINKKNRQVDLRLVERFLKRKFDYHIPLLNQKIFYDSEYNLKPWIETLQEQDGLWRNKEFSEEEQEQIILFYQKITALSHGILKKLPNFSISL